MRNIRPSLALALALSACSPAKNDGNNTARAVPANTTNSVAADDNMAGSNDSAPGNSAGAVSPKTLTLDGLGALRIGEPVPKDSDWKSSGAQLSDACITVSSPGYPGVYAIVEGGKVSRISVGQRSDVKLVEGIGVGSSEQAFKGALPGFRESPHKYLAPPAKYLTAPNAPSGDPALRVEIGTDGKIEILHVGTMPTLAYVEGCA